MKRATTGVLTPKPWGLSSSTLQTGSIEAGKLAEIIAVRENPLERIETLERVAFVMKDGRVFKNDVR